MFALPAKSISCSCLSGLSLFRVKGVDRSPSHYCWKLVFQLLNQPPVTVAMSRGAVENVEGGSDEKLAKFPKSVPLILCNVFFERFCSGGIFGEISTEARLRLSWINFLFVSFSRDLLKSKIELWRQRVHCLVSRDGVHVVLLYDRRCHHRWQLVGTV